MKEFENFYKDMEKLCMNKYIHLCFYKLIPNNIFIYGIATIKSWFSLNKEVKMNDVFLYIHVTSFTSLGNTSPNRMLNNAMLYNIAKK